MSALALGISLLAVPVAASAQQDDHHHGGNDGNGAPHSQPAPRPAPAAPAPAPAPARPAPAFAPSGRGDYGRGAGQWGGQERPQGNANNGGYARAPQAYPGGQTRPAWQGQPNGNYAGRNDGGQGRNDRGPDRNGGDPGRGYGGSNGWQGRNDGPGRNDGGPGRNDGGRYAGGRYDGGRYDGPGRGQPAYGRPGGGQWNHAWRQDNRYDWRGWREQNRDAFHVGRYYAPYRYYSYSRLSIGFYLQPLFFGSDYFISDPFYYHLPPAYGPYQWVRYYNDAVLVNTYDGQVADVIYDFFW